MPQIMILDDEKGVQDALALYSEMLGYDAIATTEPSTCRVYHSNQDCDKETPCADVLLIDQFLTTMFGLDLVERQANKGCKAPARNKAILANAFVQEDFKRARNLGCHVLQKPVTYEILENWLEKVQSG